MSPEPEDTADGREHPCKTPGCTTDHSTPEAAKSCYTRYNKSQKKEAAKDVVEKKKLTIEGVEMGPEEAKFYKILTEAKVPSPLITTESYFAGMDSQHDINDPLYTLSILRDEGIKETKIRRIMKPWHRMRPEELDKLGIAPDDETPIKKKNEDEDEELRELEEDNKRLDRDQRKEFLRLQMEARLQRAQKMVMGQDQNQGGAVIIREPTKFDPETGEPVSFKETAMPAHLYERQLMMNPGFGQRQQPKNEMTPEKVQKMITDAVVAAVKPYEDAKNKEAEEKKREKEQQVLMDKFSAQIKPLQETMTKLESELKVKGNELLEAKKELMDKEREGRDEKLLNRIDALTRSNEGLKNELTKTRTELEEKITREVGNRARTHDEKVKDAELEMEKEHHKMVEDKKEKVYDFVLNVAETEYKETKVKNQPPADMDELAADERYFAEGGAAGRAKKQKKQPPADADDEEE